MLAHFRQQNTNFLMCTGILSMSIAGNECKQNYKQTTPSMAIENHKSMAKLIARRACA